MRNIKLFQTTAEYQAAQANLIKPNVSYCKDAPNEVHYNPIVPPETRVIAKYNVTNTSSPTPISYNGYYGDGTSGFSAIEIDGVEQPSVTTGYIFSTTGEHTVKYTLKDPGTIGKCAFAYCNGITSITIPNSVTSIGQRAFEQCTGLTSIDIPNSVTSIGNNAFHICSGLTSITIPSSVTSISSYAFQGCYGLTSVCIPSGVTSILDSTFMGCSGLTSIDIPSGVTSIGNGAFRDCSSLTSIEIPSGVTSIGGYAFQDCSGLTSITIPSGVTSIGGFAFYECSGLTSVTIGSGVTSIGDMAFYQCSGLTSITVNAVTPPTLGSGVFANTNDCLIYVPSESVDAYKAATVGVGMLQEFKQHLKQW